MRRRQAPSQNQADAAQQLHGKDGGERSRKAALPPISAAPGIGDSLPCAARAGEWAKAKRLHSPDE
jgi:hypothetical protein